MNRENVFREKESCSLRTVLLNIAGAAFVVATAIGLILLAAEKLPPAPNEKTHYDHLKERGIG